LLLFLLSRQLCFPIFRRARRRGFFWGGGECVRVHNDDLAADLPGLGVGLLDDGVAAAGVEGRAVLREGEGAAADLVAARAPARRDLAAAGPAVARAAADAAALAVVVFVFVFAVGVVGGGQA
jgi:hypothetical protein